MKPFSMSSARNSTPGSTSYKEPLLKGPVIEIKIIFVVIQLLYFAVTKQTGADKT
jgi:hypothetical protein